MRPSRNYDANHKTYKTLYYEHQTFSAEFNNKVTYKSTFNITKVEKQKKVKHGMWLVINNAIMLKIIVEIVWIYVYRLSCTTIKLLLNV